jgi:hypothetical protein
MISPMVFFQKELARAQGRKLLTLALDELATANGEDRSDSDKIEFARECIKRALWQGVKSK